MRFILGFLLGIAAKTLYDVFKDEDLPNGLGLNTGRIEDLLDETRQMVRDLRDQAQRGVAAAAQQAAQSLSGDVAGGQAGSDVSPEPGGPSALMLTASESDDGSSNDAGERPSRSGGRPKKTGGSTTEQASEGE